MTVVHKFLMSGHPCAYETSLSNKQLRPVSHCFENYTSYYILILSLFATCCRLILKALTTMRLDQLSLTLTTILDRGYSWDFINQASIISCIMWTRRIQVSLTLHPPTDTLLQQTPSTLLCRFIYPSFQFISLSTLLRRIMESFAYRQSFHQSLLISSV